ncbi:hypothetical protein [Sorangium cellulosum]|nr:hypothetical protein [Sorangium cellulosum]
MSGPESKPKVPVISRPGEDDVGADRSSPLGAAADEAAEALKNEGEGT